MSQKSITENGKIPPQEIEMEAAVLGAIMVERKAINQVIEILTPDCFYKHEHMLIYEAILLLSKDFKSIDILTVTTILRKNGKLDEVGGASFITSLTNRVASSANIEFHALVVKEKYILREVIRITGELHKKAFDETSDAHEVVDELEKSLTAITNKVIKTSFKTSKELFKEAVYNNDNLLKNHGITGTTTGFSALDRITGGFQNSDLIILAARPGMGKTALALKLLTAPAFIGIPTAIFSLEMNNKQLYARIISQVTSIPLSTILRVGMNEIDLKNLMNKSDLLCGSNIFFDDTPAISLFEFRNKARRLVRDKGVRIIVIDYLQLMIDPIKGRNREGEISAISRGLKAIAKELDIPIIALAQLSRASEKRGTPIPMLSDLRESGSIEQDADMVMFIYRLEYYGILENDEGLSTKGMADILIAKHRNGDVGRVTLKFIGENTNFTDVTVDDFAKYTPLPF